MNNGLHVHDRYSLRGEVTIAAIEKRPQNHRGRFRDAAADAYLGIQPCQRGLSLRVLLIIDVKNLASDTGTSREDFVEPCRDAPAGFRADLPRRALGDLRSLRIDIRLCKARQVGLLQLLFEDEAKIRIGVGSDRKSV